MVNKKLIIGSSIILIIGFGIVFAFSSKNKTVSKQEKIVESFECGFPNKNEVKAVIYSNGDLKFEGKGDVQQYAHGEHPWQSSKNKITSVSFGEKITPVNMDYWFENMKDLKYIGKLPSSVQSVVGMCANCPEIEAGADWKECTQLNDISKVYFNCKKINEIPSIPENVINATYAFAGCANLEQTPDMEKADKLVNGIGMYSGCIELKQSSSAPNLELMDRMYESCEKLEEMPELSDKVLSLGQAFMNCINMTKASPIPKSAENITECFLGCSALKDTLTINSNPKEYVDFLKDAATKNKLKIDGASTIKDELKKTSNNKNVIIEN